MKLKLDTSFTRFLLVGGINTLVGLSVMHLCIYALNINYWFSTFTGNAVGAVFSYVLNKKITFKSDASLNKSLLKFVIVILICYFLAYGVGMKLANIIIRIVDFSQYPFTDSIAVVVGTGIYTILNYLGQRYFVFSAKKVSSVDSE